jgi:hypothetical protein
VVLQILEVMSDVNPYIPVENESPRLLQHLFVMRECTCHVIKLDGAMIHRIWNHVPPDGTNVIIDEPQEPVDVVR